MVTSGRNRAWFKKKMRSSNLPNTVITNQAPLWLQEQPEKIGCCRQDAGNAAWGHEMPHHSGPHRPRKAAYGMR